MAVALAVALALVASGIVNRVGAQALVDAPYIYSGEVTVNGQPAPDGYMIHATVGDYRSEPAIISSGRYEGLAVEPNGSRYDRQTVMFYIGNVPASETDVYRRSGIPVPHVNFNLTFPSLLVPTPTPTPELPPTATPTATPEVPAPMIFASGNVFLTGGGTLPKGAQLTAHIGGYTSDPATILTAEGLFADLVVDPQDGAAAGRDILFLIDGKAARNTAPFVGGRTLRNFDIVFTAAFPTATPIATNTPEPSPTTVPQSPPETQGMASECIRTGTVPADNPGLAQDCAILLRMKEQLEGNGELNWYLGIPIERWEGIFWKSYSEEYDVTRVRELRLSQMPHITGTISGDIGNLTELIRISTAHSNVTGEIPAAIGNLAKLEELSLKQTRFTGYIPSELGELPNLRYLHLHDNQLSGQIPSKLGNPPNLVSITLGDNNLTGCIPVSLKKFQTLRSHGHDLNGLGLLWCDDPLYTPPATSTPIAISTPTVLPTTPESNISDPRIAELESRIAVLEAKVNVLLDALFRALN